MDLKERIESIRKYQLNCNVFSVYDYDAVTLQELLNKFFTRINDCINVSNTTLDLVEWLVTEGLELEVAKKLNDWLLDGTLAKIINETLFNELNAKIDKKLDKTEFETFKNNLNGGIFLDLEKFKKLIIEKDDTERFKRALNSIPKGGTIAITKNIKLDRMTIVHNDLCLFVKDSTIVTEGIIINGNNCSIIGCNGNINGTLKTGTVDTKGIKGQNYIDFSSHNFIVGDMIYSSTGLYNGTGASPTPIKVTNVNGNRVTFEGNLKDDIEINNIIGTFRWDRTLCIKGNNSKVENIRMEYCNGYAVEFLGQQAKVNNVIFDNGGLDIIRVADGGEVDFTNCKFLKVLDPAKQSIVMYNNAHVKCYKCYFERNNCDVEFYLIGNHNNTSIQCDDCIFIATTSNLPMPFNQNSWGVVNLDVDSNATIERVIFNRCLFVDYSQGIITQPYGKNTRVNLNTVRIKDSEVKRCTLGNTVLVNSNNYKIVDTLINIEGALSQEQILITTSKTCPIVFDRVKFKDVNCQLIIEHKSRVNNCIFENVEKVNFGFNSIGYECEFINSPVSAYPVYESNVMLNLINPIFQHKDIFHMNDISKVVNLHPVGQKSIEFNFKDGTSNGIMYNTNGQTRYLLKLQCVDDIGGLFGSDWLVPERSEIEHLGALTVSDRYKYVAFTVSTRASTVVSKGSTTITVGGVYGVLVDDYINIVCNDGRIHTTKITAITGTTLTLRNGIIQDVDKDSKVCIFSYTERNA